MTGSRRTESPRAVRSSPTLTYLAGRELDPDWVRPPLGRHSVGWAEKVSDMWVAKNAWHRDELGRKVLADLLSRRTILPADLRRHADWLETAR